ncbi:hypothetical protein Pmani_017447 [Petrolisthes manimaculis]|uniref:Uncharacterized protein n=1 Tax=Petrolisthes manimaculis TaxID=1843537 RepID=A0AAE1PQ40_9EUCA|nr:hypothetical protein Pmani_017447 [Petrolisthes manimaculis]
MKDDMSGPTPPTLSLLIMPYKNNKEGAAGRYGGQERGRRHIRTHGHTERHSSNNAVDHAHLAMEWDYEETEGTTSLTADPPSQYISSICC